MMKKKLLVILIIIILAAIFINNIIQNVISNTNQKNIKNISLQDIIRYLYASKDEILTELGNDYLTVETGAEGVYHGLFFKELGITITLDEEDGKVLWIECDEKVDVNGAKAGMTFSEIQKILGKGEIKQNWIETPENIVYELSYIFDKCIVFFQSYKKDGANSIVFIMPNPSQ